MQDIKSLANTRVLVTGADGFIGSHLVERLVETGCHVRAFVYYNAFDRWGWLDTLALNIKEQIDVVCGDVRDPHGVMAAAKDCSMIFHLAALIGIPFSYHSPDSYVDTNVKGTLNVLQAARDLRTERVLVTSTSEVYGTARSVPIDETHAKQAQSPYAATKIAADALAESFYKSFGTPIVIVRPFNTYGPRQSTRAVIPTIITQLLAGRKSVKLGELSTTRDLVFVQDAAEGFIRLAMCDGCIGEEVNIATNREISIGDLAKTIIEEIAPDTTIVCDESRLRPEKSEVMQLLGANAKLKRLTGWSPDITLAEGISRTIKWFRENLDVSDYKVDKYSI